MVSTDPLSDMLTRIRNAVAAGQPVISLPHSNIKETVARILSQNGFLKAVSVSGEGKTKRLEISLTEGAGTAITEIARLSKPGRRLYVANDEIPTIKSGRGIVLISTSQGVMTGQDARDRKLGGELICRVY